MWQCLSVPIMHSMPSWIKHFIVIASSWWLICSRTKGRINHWIGLTFDTRARNWKWYDGTWVAYTKWDGRKAPKGRSGLCFRIKKGGKWKPKACSRSLPGICEQVRTPSLDVVCISAVFVYPSSGLLQSTVQCTARVYFLFCSWNSWQFCSWNIIIQLTPLLPVLQPAATTLKTTKTTVLLPATSDRPGSSTLLTTVTEIPPLLTVKQTNSVIVTETGVDDVDLPQITAELDDGTSRQQTSSRQQHMQLTSVQQTTPEGNCKSADSVMYMNITGGATGFGFVNKTEL